MVFFGQSFNLAFEQRSSIQEAWEEVVMESMWEGSGSMAGRMLGNFVV